MALDWILTFENQGGPGLAFQRFTVGVRDTRFFLRCCLFRCMTSVLRVSTCSAGHMFLASAQSLRKHSITSVCCYYQQLGSFVLAHDIVFVHALALQVLQLLIPLAALTRRSADAA